MPGARIRIVRGEMVNREPYSTIGGGGRRREVSGLRLDDHERVRRLHREMFFENPSHVAGQVLRVESLEEPEFVRSSVRAPLGVESIERAREYVRKLVDGRVPLPSHAEIICGDTVAAGLGGYDIEVSLPESRRVKTSGLQFMLFRPPSGNVALATLHVLQYPDSHMLVNKHIGREPLDAQVAQLVMLMLCESPDGFEKLLAMTAPRVGRYRKA